MTRFRRLTALDAQSAMFDGVGLGHPLIPAARMVRNDVCMGRDLSSSGGADLQVRENPICWLSADPTCPARARCCGRSA